MKRTLRDVIDDLLEEYFRAIEDVAWSTASHPLDGNLALAVGGVIQPHVIHAKETRKCLGSKQPRYVALPKNLDRAMKAMRDAHPKWYAAIKQKYTGDGCDFMSDSAYRTNVCRGRQYVLENIGVRS